MGNMEHLWAPWRNAYVKKEKQDIAKLFLEIGSSTDDCEHFVITRSKATFAVLNRYPYNGGHSLVVPYREVADLTDLTEDETQDLWQTVNRVNRALRSCFKPDGINIGINIGAAAGAGIPNHLHVHVVPRWHGDTNFMTSVNESRIHPADLQKVHEQLHTWLLHHPPAF